MRDVEKAGNSARMMDDQPTTIKQKQAAIEKKPTMETST